MRAVRRARRMIAQTDAAVFERDDRGAQQRDDAGQARRWVRIRRDTSGRRSCRSSRRGRRSRSKWRRRTCRAVIQGPTNRPTHGITPIDHRYSTAGGTKASRKSRAEKKFFSRPQIMPPMPTCQPPRPVPAPIAEMIDNPRISRPGRAACLRRPTARSADSRRSRGTPRRG